MAHLSHKHFNSYKEGVNLEFLRDYCIEHGETRLMKRGEVFEKAGEPSQLVADYPNCLSGKKSEVTIVAGTSCKVFQILGKELERLLDAEKSKDLRQTISDSLFSQIYAQYLDSYRMTTRERYKRLLFRCPELVQSINLKDLASFLKVTPTTISNIRREITFG